MKSHLVPTLSAIACAAFMTAVARSADEGHGIEGDASLYATQEDPALDLIEEVTLEAWVRAEPMGKGGGRILDKSEVGTQRGYMLDTFPWNSLRFLNAKGMCQYDAKLAGDRWTHVVGVYSAPRKIMKLYLDGREVASIDSGEFRPMTPSKVPLCIGADPDGGNRFRGSILRAAVYRRALATEEVLARSKTTNPTPLDGVLAEWAFNPRSRETIQPVAGKIPLRIAGPIALSPYAGELIGEAPAPAQPLSLWYRRPAQNWSQALPIGNGRLGAMIFGGIETERLQFNEDTIWTGKPHEYHHEGAVRVLPELRRLLAEGKQKEAEKLAMDDFMSIPIGQRAYQPFGDLIIACSPCAKVVDYRRELDIDAAIARVGYRCGDARFTREVFASYPDQLIIWRISADRPGSVSFTAHLQSPHRSARPRSCGPDEIALAGDVAPDGVRFEARLKAMAEGGKVTIDGGGIRVEGGNAVTLLLAGASSFKSFRDISGDPAALCESALRAAATKSYPDLLAAHQKDYRDLFQRVTLDLGTTAISRAPTDERLKAVASQPDPQLAALFCQYGRYLLIASSRPGTQPANLQGIWNDLMRPPWDSKWTVNINTEMNYWPAEVGNLSECHAPLFDLIEDCVITGRKTAKEHYGCDGWVLHHNTDLWRGTSPINHSNHGIWVTGGAWLCHHMWEHYLFTGDKGFLAKRAYPAMREAALFFTNFLVEDPTTGRLISGPSNSPEQGGLVMGPTMDHQIIRSLFGYTIEAAAILGTDKEFASKLATLRARIAPNTIGQHGQLQEWMEDKDDPKNTHRHISHLWGLYPGWDITTRGTPEFAAAAKQSLLFRGDGGTGWSKAWKINFWARFLDGDHAHKMLIEALAGNTYPNLFDAHPPFQIDGNFGGSAGVMEMLLQSHAGEIELLPALPTAWPNGSATGLRARGAFDVALAWKDGRLSTATLRSLLGNPRKIRYRDRVITLDSQPGEVIRLNGELARQR
ncbi:MAG TPA: glycoside hydrolase N-terminal domain-containing protein [Verrucomicrobiae bacterium]|nr:glycoside hydrolase N-terminal domain-containing protein [Verrucomicrobiae bacterium]